MLLKHFGLAFFCFCCFSCRKHTTAFESQAKRENDQAYHRWEAKQDQVKIEEKEVLLYNPETELGTYHGSFTVPYSGGHLSEHITIQLLENQQVIHTAFIESSGMAIFKNGTYLVSQENILVHLTQFVQKRFDDTSGVILADTIEDNTIDEKMVFKLIGKQLILAVDSTTYTFTR